MAAGLQHRMFRLVSEYKPHMNNTFLHTGLAFSERGNNYFLQSFYHNIVVNNSFYTFCCSVQHGIVCSVFILRRFFTSMIW